MCITSTARRRSLTLQVLPSHLLTTSTEAGSSPSKTSSSIAAAVAASTTSNRITQASPETQPTFSQRSTAKAHKKSKKSSASSRLPHHDGLVVQHHYHDHSADPTVDPTQIKYKAKGGVITPFPVKLHDMLDKIEADGLAHVVSWQPHGRCFVVHKPKEFVNHVMPHYFKQTKMASFQRQLNLYGFNRLTGGTDKGGYYHEMFLRGRAGLAYDIHRKRVKGTGVRLPTNPDNEPNFYVLPPMVKGPVPMMSSPQQQARVNRSSPSNTVPPLPALPKISSPKAAASAGLVNMSQRRADLLRESHDHSMKIAKQQQRQQPQFKQVRRQASARPRQQAQKSEADVVFFEGLPFHYLDPSALPSRPGTAKPAATRRSKPRQQPPSKQHASSGLPEVRRPKFAHSSSTVVSESGSSGDESESKEDSHHNAFLPSFSPSNMDWDGPLSCPTLQAHMRRSSFQSFAKDTALVEAMSARPIEEDIESFFQGFDMPVDMYHDQIERMHDDDDTAFGYLLEQAITD